MVNYKALEHERMGDAPFIGVYLCATDCNFNCQNCFNQELKKLPTLNKTAKAIIKEVESNPFNKGIILSGLEWTLQPNDMTEIIAEALKENLEVILYTGLDEIDFKNSFPHIYSLPIFIKFGRYNESEKIDSYYSYGIKLASSNQCIKWMGSKTISEGLT